MGTLSTHLLDTSIGLPAEGVRVVLTRRGAPSEPVLGEGVTDADGRIAAIGPQRLDAGDYQLCFEVADYFSAAGRTAFYPEVIVVFTIAEDGTDAGAHYHVPVLLNPFGFATYRGS
jgi:5-hydroxyisourate hydrolase